MIEEMKLREIIQLMNMLNNNEPHIRHNGEQVRIIMLERGWILIGKYHQDGSRAWIENGYVIRQWGTSKGLGQLAVEGKQEKTILDEIPRTEFSVSSIIATIVCDKDKWNKLCQ